MKQKIIVMSYDIHLYCFYVKHPNGQLFMSLETSLSAEDKWWIQQGLGPVSVAIEENQLAAAQAVVQSPPSQLGRQKKNWTSAED